MIGLDQFAAQIGTDGNVTITGLGTRGGPVPGLRCVQAPTGIEWVQPDEMIVSCAAGTPVDELVVALAEHRQTVALPAGGTVGGALVVGRADVRRLGYGPVRDVLLQARYVSAAGEVVKAGGPTVKNVSGFDLCRLLVGSHGTLGFLGDVILRTRPLPQASQWFTRELDDPGKLFSELYKPVSVLWNGTRVWALLEGHPADVAEQAAGTGLTETDGPPPLPTGGRRSVSPAALASLPGGSPGEFVVEVGVGVVHLTDPWPPVAGTERATALSAAIRHEFDPTGRLNPGLDV